MSPTFDDPYFDAMRKWVQFAGPKEGRDPVRVSRAFTALRRSVLAASPADFGLAPSERLPRVWAVLVDLEVGADVAALACVADGSTSLYWGSGGGILGEGSGQPVAAAATRLLEVAERVLDVLPEADRIALPVTGSLAFLVLAYEGMRRLEVAEAETLKAGPGAAHELHVATQDVIAALRLADAAADAPKES